MVDKRDILRIHFFFGTCYYDLFKILKDDKKEK